MAIKKRPVSPRQKMINLMYVILMAMLALNVSGDVLQGFDRIRESLWRSTEASQSDNDGMYHRIEDMMGANPAKTGGSYEMAQELREESSRLRDMIDGLCNMIADEADGKDGDPSDLRNKEDMEAAAQVMLSPKEGKGERLRETVEGFRELAASMTGDPVKADHIREILSTEVPEGNMGKDWQEYMFESIPAVAAVTSLIKLKSDILHAEREALSYLLSSIDEKDLRMNAFQAVVIPNSRTVVKGNEYRADILMAAVDTTDRWNLYIDGEKTDILNGKYSVRTSATGQHTIEGWLETKDRDGQTLRREFKDRYTVIDPIATVSADMTNVLYIGYDNPVSISIPGHSPGEVKAVMEGGVLKMLAPGKYTARPDGKGQALISVFATEDGKDTPMGQYAFRVRTLPDPAPYIEHADKEGHVRKYRSGAIPRSALNEVTHLDASLDDGILDVPYTVTSFEAVFFDNRGNAVPVASEGASFSQRQKDTFRQLTAGKRLYITRVTVKGPDGAERTLNSSMELIVR